MKLLKQSLCILLACLATFLISCDDDAPKNAQLEVRLTDAPGNFEEVNIDIQDVQINRTTESGTGWESIELESKGVYNLLELTNGLDTLLGSLSLPAGNVAQIRMVLGTSNSVKVNGQLYDLSTPSAQQSGLKININQTLLEGISYQLILDFDVARSIVARGNKTYLLKPVIRSFVEASSGAVQGLIIPRAANPAVYAMDGTDTLGTTMPDAEGRFLLRGLPGGIYSVSFAPVSGYLPRTVENVTVTVGNVTNLGTVVIDPQ